MSDENDKKQPKKAYSVDEFGKLYGISRSRAYDEMKEGRLKFRKCGRRRLIGADDAEGWWNSL
jgi:excisionase family DNA binding protein